MADSSTMYEVAVPNAVPPESHRQGAFTLYRISVQARTRGSVSVATCSDPPGAAAEAWSGGRKSN